MIDEINVAFGFEFKEEEIHLNRGWTKPKMNIFGEINTKLDVFREVFYNGDNNDFSKLLVNLGQASVHDKIYFSFWALTCRNNYEKCESVLFKTFSPELFKDIMLKLFNCFHTQTITDFVNARPSLGSFQVAGEEHQHEPKPLSMQEERLKNNIFKRKVVDFFSHSYERFNIPELKECLIKHIEYMNASASDLQLLPLVKESKEREKQQLKVRNDNLKDARNNPRLAELRQKKMRKGRKV